MCYGTTQENMERQKIEVNVGAITEFYHSLILLLHINVTYAAEGLVWFCIIYGIEY